MCAHMHAYRGQRTTCKHWFSLMWASGIELRSSGLCSKSFYPLSHLSICLFRLDLTVSQPETCYVDLTGL